MPSLITAVFKASVSLLAGCNRVVEADKLKERHITDDDIRKSIVCGLAEIDEYFMSSSNLDGSARQELSKSIGYFKEGVLNLFKLLNLGNVSSEESDEHRSVR